MAIRRTVVVFVLWRVLGACVICAGKAVFWNGLEARSVLNLEVRRKTAVDLVPSICPCATDFSGSVAGR